MGVAFGAGGGHGSAPPPVLVGSGQGAAWVFRPAGPPGSVVLLLHGFGEIDPDGLRPWIDHLVANGSTVVYPEWQETLLTDPRTFLAGALVGARVGAAAADAPAVPTVVVGYSAGGILAVETAALADRVGLPRPAAVLSVFPGRRLAAAPDVFVFPLQADLGRVPAETPIVLLAGDRDHVVGQIGVDELAAGLTGHDPRRLEQRLVRTNAAFTADHLAPGTTSDGARAAFWAPADALIAEARAATRT